MNALVKATSALLILGTRVALLTGCSTGNPEPTNTTTATQRESGVLGILGVRICVTNKTTEVAKIEWRRYGRADKLDKSILRVGATTCAEGWESSLMENDVTVKVTWPDRLSQVFTAWNQSVGGPQVRVDASKQVATEACGFEFNGEFDILVPCSDGYGVNESRTYLAYDYHESILKRIADSRNNKEFVMTLVK